MVGTSSEDMILLDSFPLRSVMQIRPLQLVRCKAKKRVLLVSFGPLLDPKRRQGSFFCVEKKAWREGMAARAPAVLPPGFEKARSISYVTSRDSSIRSDDGRSGGRRRTTSSGLRVQTVSLGSRSRLVRAVDRKRRSGGTNNNGNIPRATVIGGAKVRHLSRIKLL